ncbi:MAG TPA: transposase [Chloroflexota bacterium]|nr:transposase [Chloroflexota bacterium]
MSSVLTPTTPVQPTRSAPLVRLLAYTQSLGLEPYLARRKRGLSTLVLSLVWLVLAWQGSGRPHHLRQLSDPLLAAVLSVVRLPTPQTLHRSLTYFSAQAIRAAVEAAYRAELPRRAGRIWVALDSHQVPYWGRDQRDRLRKGWSGQHSRVLRGYRLYLATDTATGQVLTFLLLRGDARDTRYTAVLARRVRHLLGHRLAGIVADSGFTSRAAIAALLQSRIPFILGFARSARIRARLAALTGQQRRWLQHGGAIRLGWCHWEPRLQLLALSARHPTDGRGPWVYVTSIQGLSPGRLAALYRQRWRVEQAIDELVNGQDLDHLVTTRLHPNRVALGFQLLARNLALGFPLHLAQGQPTVLREPRAFRAAHVEGLGLFERQQATLVLLPLQPASPQLWALPWTRQLVRLIA